MTTHPAPSGPSGNRFSLRLISAGTASSRRGPSLLTLAAFVLLVVVTFLGMVWSRTLLDEGAFQLADLQNRMNRRLLRTVCSVWRSPDWRIPTGSLRLPSRWGCSIPMR